MAKAWNELKLQRKIAKAKAKLSDHGIGYITAPRCSSVVLACYTLITKYKKMLEHQEIFQAVISYGYAEWVKVKFDVFGFC